MKTSGAYNNKKKQEISFTAHLIRGGKTNLLVGQSSKGGEMILLRASSSLLIHQAPLQTQEKSK